MFAQVFCKWTALLAIPAVTVYLASLGLTGVRDQDMRDTQIERIALEISTQISARDGDFGRADEAAASFAEALGERLDQPMTDRQVRDVLQTLKHRGFSKSPGEDQQVRALRWARWIEHYAEGKQLTHAP
jgi:hypothetical protein